MKMGILCLFFLANAGQVTQWDFSQYLGQTIPDTVGQYKWTNGEDYLVNTNDMKQQVNKGLYGDESLKYALCPSSSITSSTFTLGTSFSIGGFVYDIFSSGGQTWYISYTESESDDSLFLAIWIQADSVRISHTIGGTFQEFSFDGTDSVRNQWKLHNLAVDVSSTDTTFRYFIDGALQDQLKTIPGIWVDTEAASFRFGIRHGRTVNHQNAYHGFIHSMMLNKPAETDISAYYGASIGTCSVLNCINDPNVHAVNAWTPWFVDSWSTFCCSETEYECPTNDCNICTVWNDDSFGYWQYNDSISQAITCTDQCDGACATWDGPFTSGCKTCASNYFDQDNGASAKPSCIECHGNWASCNDTSETSCLSCNDPKYLEGSSCIDDCAPKWGNDSNREWEDKTVCAGNDYFDESNNTCSSTCASECETWNGPTNTNWLTCSDGNYSQPSNTSTCASTCPQTHYGEDSDKTCQGWHDICGTCNGPNINNCTGCDLAHTIISSNNEWICAEKYIDTDTHIDHIDCQPCAVECLQCTGTTSAECNGCETGYLALDSTTCVSSCPSNYYQYDSATWAACDGCANCTGPSSSEWLCDDLSEYRQPASNSNDWAATWPEYYYGDDTTKACEACADPCKTCTGPDANQWTDWNDSQNATLQGSECFCSDNSIQTEKFCFSCAAEWESCHGEANTQCDSCKTGFYFLSSTCYAVCPDGTYATNDQCQPCNADCVTWEGPNPADCSQCKETYASPASQPTGACVCNDGAYTISSTPGSVSCGAWDPLCATCTGGTSSDCQTCSDGAFFAPGSASTCVAPCPDLHFGDNNTKTCKECHSECTAWVSESEQDCTTCINTLSRPSPSYGGTWLCHQSYEVSRYPLICASCHDTWESCSGPEANDCLTWYKNARLENYQCNCVDGVYPNSTSANCTLCHTSCATWNGGLETQCITCPNYGFLTSEGKCDSCDIGEYYESNEGSWSHCYHECLTCKEYPACLTCQGDGESPDSQGVCQMDEWVTGSFKDSVTLQCQQCYVTCRECSSIANWQSCIENATLTNNNDCICNTEYSETENGCVQDAQPTYSLEVISAEEVLMKFDAPIDSDLKSSDIEKVEVVGPNGEAYSVEWTMVQVVDRKEYRLNLDFNGVDIAAGSQITIQLDTKIAKPTDEGSSQETKELVPSNNSDDQDDDDDGWYSEIGLPIQILGIVVVVSSIVSGVITGDFHSLWNLFNALQIIYFIPMMPHQIPEQLVKTMKSLEFTLIPNLFEFTQNSDDLEGHKPYHEAKEFGYDSSAFIMNSGEVLSKICLGLLIFPVALVLVRCNNMRIKSCFRDIISNYKYNFFIRAWIQIYLDIAVAALLQMINTDYSNSTLASNSIISYVFMASIIPTPLVTTILLYKSRSNITNPTPEYKKRYGSVFEEFKNFYGTISTMYYSLFLWRRLIYAVNIIFMRDYVFLQFMINIAHSGLQTIFVLTYIPYLKRCTNLVSIYIEISTILVFCLSFSFEYISDQGLSDFVKWVAIVIIMTVLGALILDIIFTQYNDCKKRRKENENHAIVQPTQIDQFTNKSMTDVSHNTSGLNQDSLKKVNQVKDPKPRIPQFQAQHAVPEYMSEKNFQIAFANRLRFSKLRKK